MELFLNLIQQIKVIDPQDDSTPFVNLIKESEKFRLNFQQAFDAQRKSTNGRIFLMMDVETNEVEGAIYCELTSHHVNFGKQVPTFGWLMPANFEAAQFLLNTMEKYVKNAGYNLVRGPINFPKLYGGWGVMVEGFKWPHMIEEAKNNPELSGWLELLGYTEDAEYISLVEDKTREFPNMHPEVNIVSWPINELLAKPQIMNQISTLISQNFEKNLPDCATMGNELPMIVKILNSVPHSEDFYSLALDKDEKLVGIFVNIPNIFEVWAGKPLTSCMSDTMIVDKAYRGTKLLFELYNTTIAHIKKRGIHPFGNLIWSKNKTALEAFMKWGSIAMRHKVYRKALSD